MQKEVEFYLNEDGGVNRRVTKTDDGIDMVTSDIEVAEDAHEFLSAHPDAHVVDYNTRASAPLPNPETVPVDQLDEFLERFDSIDDVIAMRDLDQREGTEDRYNVRAQELFMGQVSEDVPEPQTVPQGDASEEGDPRVF
jgi:hypothetical protein